MKRKHQRNLIQSQHGQAHAIIVFISMFAIIGCVMLGVSSAQSANKYQTTTYTWVAAKKQCTKKKQLFTLSIAGLTATTKVVAISKVSWTVSDSKNKTKTKYTPMGPNESAIPGENGGASGIQLPAGEHLLKAQVVVKHTGLKLNKYPLSGYCQ